MGPVRAARCGTVAPCVGRTVAGKLLVSGGDVSTANVPPQGGTMDWIDAPVSSSEVGD